MGFVLALDAASARCGAGIVVDGELVVEERAELAQGQAARLTEMTQRVLRQAGTGLADLDYVAVIVGPGSFTGIRAALALAHGLALGTNRRVVGVTVGEALAVAVRPLSGRELWVATDSRRDRVFLDRGGQVEAFVLADLPDPQRPVAVAGEQAIEVAARLAARDFDVLLTDARYPGLADISRAARERVEGRLPPRTALPLYVDPPEARLPAGGLRPPPA